MSVSLMHQWHDSCVGEWFLTPSLWLWSAREWVRGEWMHPRSVIWYYYLLSGECGCVCNTRPSQPIEVTPLFTSDILRPPLWISYEAIICYYLICFWARGGNTEYFIWNTLSEYFIWNTLSEYFIWKTLSEILYLKYFIWMWTLILT